MKRNTISPYEQELILAHILKKSREHVLAHPKLKLTKLEEKKLQAMIARRLKNEPLAYILGHKGFYGLDFKVTRHTLIPRPETEHIIELVTYNIKHKIQDANKKSVIIDVGTGSGNIIISIAHSIRHKKYDKISFYGTDISTNALKIAKFNAKKYKLDNPPAGGIKFIKSDLLNYFLDNLTIRQFDNLIIVANLPYLSKKIYASSMPDVKNFEPMSALLSGTDGLDHYRKLFKQLGQLIKNYYMLRVTCYMEFSPEQKKPLVKLIKKYFPESAPKFKKDLAGKWRLAIFKVHDFVN